MKTLRNLCLGLAASLIFSSCGTAALPESSQEIPVVSAVESREPDSEDTLRDKYSPNFYIVDGALIDYVGANNFDDWWKQHEGETLSVLDVIKAFHIGKEEFQAVAQPGSGQDALYTWNEIDALYSGDMFFVNRAFCSPAAVFNESDGEIYSLNWLASHESDDYFLARLSLDKIREVLDRVESSDEYSSWLPLAEQVEPILAKAEAERDAAGSGSCITLCYTHNFTYHSIDAPLINYIGFDAFNEWLDSLGHDYNDWNFDETGSIVEFVEHFQISKETFISLTRDGVDEEFIKEHDSITMYSMEQIDAIYSGDPWEVNRVFCGPMAVYNQNNGQLYSLHWIVDHSAEECVAMGLPLDRVRQIVEDAQTEDYWDCNDLGKEAVPILEEMEAIEASGGLSDEEPMPYILQCQEHTFSYHAVDGCLTSFVGDDKVMEWYNTFTGQIDSYCRSAEGFTIVAFVEHFQISKEDFIRVSRKNITQEFVESIGMTMDEYLEEFGYTDEQIDAIYSGDQKKINRAFCGSLAVYNENDGELYSIYWMAEHTAEDYIAAGLSLDQVREVVELSLSTEPTADYSQWSHYGKAVEPILEQAEAIEASGTNS